MTPSSVQSKNYSGEDVFTMQQDAIRRVREMQKRAKININQSNNSFNENINLTQEKSAKSDNTTQENQTENRAQPQQNFNNHNKNPTSQIKNQVEQTVQSLTQLPKKAFSSISSILEEFGIDNEKLILIVMIFLLANEGEDKTLLLALGYLLF